MLASIEPITTKEDLANSVASKKVCLGMAEEEPKLYVKKLSPLAKLPVRGSAKAAGYDLCR